MVGFVILLKTGFWISFLIIVNFAIDYAVKGLEKQR